MNERMVKDELNIIERSIIAKNTALKEALEMLKDYKEDDCGCEIEIDFQCGICSAIDSAEKALEL